MSWLISILDAINRLHVFSTEELANFCKVPGTKYFCGPCGLAVNTLLCCCGSHGHLQMSKPGRSPTWLFMDAEMGIYIFSKYHKIWFFKSFSSIYKCKDHSWFIGHTETGHTRPLRTPCFFSTVASFLNTIYSVEAYLLYLVGNGYLD